MLAATTQRTRRSSVRRVAALVAAAGLLVGLGACSADVTSGETPSVQVPTSADAYRLGCAAVDAAVTGSGAAKEASIKALEMIRDSGQLDPQPTQFVKSAISALKTSSIKDLPAETRKTLISGCKQAGHPLKNL
jgi:hypothetical protein